MAWRQIQWSNYPSSMKRGPDMDWHEALKSLAGFSPPSNVLLPSCTLLPYISRHWRDHRQAISPVLANMSMNVLDWISWSTFLIISEFIIPRIIVSLMTTSTSFNKGVSIFSLSGSHLAFRAKNKSSSISYVNKEMLLLMMNSFTSLWQKIATMHQWGAHMMDLPSSELLQARTQTLSPQSIYLPHSHCRQHRRRSPSELANMLPLGRPLNEYSARAFTFWGSSASNQAVGFIPRGYDVGIAACWTNERHSWPL